MTSNACTRAQIRYIFLSMRPPLYSPIARVRPQPDGPAAARGRPRGSRRPHTDAKVAAVRRLIEQTPLTYGEIAAKTGVGRASICRWTARRPMAASGVRAARDRYGAARPRQRATEGAHAGRAPRRARRAHDPRAGGQRGRRSRQARRGAGASEDGEARRPPAKRRDIAPRPPKARGFSTPRRAP